MTLDRSLGAVVVLFGLALLFFLIPTHVDVRAGQPMDPSLFPRIAAWMFVVLGTALVIKPGARATLPPVRTMLTALGLIGAVGVAVIGLKHVGFLPSAICLMIVVAVIANERRPLWIATIVLAVPFSIWGLFEEILQRPLP